MNMTKPTNEMCELNPDGLAQVSGGFFTPSQLGALRREEGKLAMEVHEHELTPTKAAGVLRDFERKLILQGHYII
jgi:hypothetical protein